MISFAKISTYAAWITIAVVAAAARPANADIFDRFDTEPGVSEPTRTGPGRADTFNEAYSFADVDERADLDDSLIADPQVRTTPATPQPDSISEAALLIGTWAWEGRIEGVPAYMQTAFYRDGTYESYLETAIMDMYETGYWVLLDGVLTTEVVDYAPRMVQTPYGPQPLEIEPEYQLSLAFLDADTVETEFGLSYRID